MHGQECLSPDRRPEPAKACHLLEVALLRLEAAADREMVVCRRWAGMRVMNTDAVPGLLKVSIGRATQVAHVRALPSFKAAAYVCHRCSSPILNCNMQYVRERLA